MQARFPGCQSAIARWFLLIGCFGLLTTSSGCLWSSRHEAQAQSEQREGEPGELSVSVQTAIAQPDSLDEVLEYTGTTAPIQQVNLRARVEGQLVSLAVNVGDFVEAGQTLGRIDDDLLITDVNEAQAELAALQSEVAQARAQVDNAQALVERARVEYQQAQTDNARFQSLAADGAISQQQADLAETAMKTAEQALRSAQQGVQTQQQGVVAAQGRVNAQQAVLAQTEEQRSYTLLKSPITGSVLERITEAGSMLQPGDEIAQLGDFSTVKIIVQASELDLAQIRVGQSVDVRFDAFPGRSFTGEVARISPAADPVARLVPIEVTLPNPNGQIGSGLLARVDFAPRASQRVVIPDSALETGTNQETPTLFIVEGSGDNATVIARQVQLGDRANGRIEIRAGLEPGEPFVIKSSAPLEDGQSVKLSILSETPSE